LQTGAITSPHVLAAASAAGKPYRQAIQAQCAGSLNFKVSSSKINKALKLISALLIFENETLKFREPAHSD